MAESEAELFVFGGFFALYNSDVVIIEFASCTGGGVFMTPVVVGI